jgi:hypothetical protein
MTAMIWAVPGERWAYVVVLATVAWVIGLVVARLADCFGGDDE